MSVRKLTIVEIEIFHFDLASLGMLILQVHSLGEILAHLAALSDQSIDLVHVKLVGVIVYLLLLIVGAAAARVPLQELR